MATGEYVTFFDSDNILLPNACEIVRREIMANGPGDVYFSDIRYFETDRPSRLMRFTVQRITEVTLESLVRQNFINLLGTFLRREAVQRAGGFDDRFRFSEEHVLWLRLVLRANAKFTHISKVLGHLRFHASNLTWERSYLVEAAEANFAIYDWLEREVSEKFTEARREPLLAELNAQRARWLFRAGIGGVVMKDKALANRYFERWDRVAGKSGFVLGIVRFLVFITPVTIASPTIMYLRRRFVMRRYVAVAA
jgi:glycosyltransferase involved in cell wall biosynthesis